MKTIPILFSTEMVQALLDGRKTQTRRVVKTRFSNTDLVMRDNKHGKRLIELQNDVPEPVRKENPDGTFSTTHHVKTFSEVKSPYGQPGDVLWVRETWAETVNVNSMQEWPGRPHIETERRDFPDDAVWSAYIWRADGEWNWCDDDGFDTEKSCWKPSIHMPKAAARLFLKITDVRVERLQDISGADAVAEGVKMTWISDGIEECKYKNYINDGRGSLSDASESYKTLWQRINGTESWDANPWVWVVTFEKTEKPENF